MVSTINLLDIRGRLLKQVAQNNFVTGQQTQLIDLNDLPNGVYFIELIADNRRASYKIIKQ